MGAADPLLIQRFLIRWVGSDNFDRFVPYHHDTSQQIGTAEGIMIRDFLKSLDQCGILHVRLSTEFVVHQSDADTRQTG